MTDSLALLAFVVSIISLYISLQKYLVDRATPWVNILLKYVETELTELAAEARLFSQVHTVPFENLVRKKERFASLSTSRDASLQRLDMLVALTEAADKLRGLRAELNEVTDSFDFNEELSVSKTVADGLKIHYEKHSRAYAAELQRVAKCFCKRKFIFR